MRMTADQIERHLAHVQAKPAAPRRGVVGTILLAGIEDTDRFAMRYPALMFLGLILLIILASVLEKVLP